MPWIGLESVKVMNSLTTLTVEDRNDPENILTALGNYFMPQKHLLFERIKFGFTNQTEHESIDQYGVKFAPATESCEFEVSVKVYFAIDSVPDIQLLVTGYLGNALSPVEQDE